MRDIIGKFLVRKISPESFDTKLGKLASFAVGLLVLVLSGWKLARLELTETELFFGVLLSLAVCLLFVVMGLLLPLAASAAAIKGHAAK